MRYLLERGGSSTVAELMERFAGEKTRARDFKRRQLADLLGKRRQYEGKELSVGPPIIEISHDVVSLVPDWLDALEKHRILGGEQDAALRQRTEHLLQRAAYRDRRKNPPERAPTEEELAEGREARQKRRRIDVLAYSPNDLEGGFSEVRQERPISSPFGGCARPYLDDMLGSLRSETEVRHSSYPPPTKIGDKR